MQLATAEAIDRRVITGYYLSPYLSTTPVLMSQLVGGHEALLRANLGFQLGRHKDWNTEGRLEKRTIQLRLLHWSPSPALPPPPPPSFSSLANRCDTSSCLLHLQQFSFCLKVGCDQCQAASLCYTQQHAECE